MFRARIRKLPFLQAKNKATTRIHAPTLQSIRTNSNVNQSSGGRTVKRLLLGTGTLVTIAGGTVAYAKYDPEFRKTVEGKVPYSDLAFNYIFENVFGEKSVPPAKKSSQRNSDDSASEKGLLQKQIERKAKEQTLPPPPPIETSEIPKAIDKTTEPEATGKKTNIINESEEIEKIEKKLAVMDSQIKIKNKELDALLKKSLDELESLVDEASASRKKAAHATHSHAQKLTQEIEKCEGDTDKIVWSDINSINEVKKVAVNESTQLVNSASEKIVKLKSLIEESRANKATSANKNLFPAEDNIEAAYNKLAKAEKQFLDAQFEEKTAMNFKTILEDLKAKYQSELKAILPTISSTEIGDHLTKEDVNNLFIFTCKKIDTLNQALARQQASEQQHVKEAIQKQMTEDELVSENTVAIALARQNRELTILQQKKVQEIKEEYDYELRQGLRRQLSAHVEHVQECLKTQAKNLEIEYKELIDQKVLEEKADNEATLSSSYAKLKSIEEFLFARADLDKASRKAKELWLACQALKTTLKVGRLEDINSDINLKPLKEELSAIKKAAGEANPFVRALIDSIPEEALDRGVYTEEALRERFKKVERICRRVAIIDDAGGTLFKYFISYMQSFFILSPSVPLEEIEKDHEVDISSLSTFDIVSRVQLCLQQDNLEQALRYVNLLKGEPRSVAFDWIKELKMLLETRQAADALIAHAAATSVQAYH